MHNPFRRADKHGAPDMRVTAPVSAETPMSAPTPRILLVGICDGEEWSIQAPRDLARKMAAAPDLLALAEAIYWLPMCGELPQELVSQLIAAIAKARGETA